MIPQINSINIPASSLPDYFDQAVNAGVPPLVSHKGQWTAIVSANDLGKIEVVLRDPGYNRETEATFDPNAIVGVATYTEVEVLQ